MNAASLVVDFIKACLDSDEGISEEAYKALNRLYDSLEDEQSVSCHLVRQGIEEIQKKIRSAEGRYYIVTRVAQA